MIGVELIAAALGIAAVLRLALIARPLAGTKLPHPSQVPGLPMAGPASMAAAHAALTGRRT